LAHFWAVRDDIKGLWSLSLAIEKSDDEAIRQECIYRRPNSKFDSQTDWAEFGEKILCVDISIMLNSEEPPRIILWEKQGALVALTMAKTVKCGAYLALLNLIASKKTPAECPNCGEAFLIPAKGKKYCKDACQNAAKAQRSRARKKAVSVLPKPR
jgi:predicted nucleic acid-binding Zn ribbon protein